MKPIPRVPGKIPRELNYDIIYGGCLKYQLRVILYTQKDGFILRVTDLENKVVEEYYRLGSGIKITMGILYRIKQDLKQKYKDECRSSI